MTKTDNGEFELVLGNRQLISVFLIVVILLAVFFSMGYIVGRNSAPVGPSEMARTGGKSVAVEPPSASSQPASPSPATSPSQEPAAGASPAASAPAGSADTKPAPAEPPTTHREKPTPVPSAAAPAASAKPNKPQVSAPAVVTRDPAPGEYWQVVATARADAEIITEAIAKKGFHAIVAPGPRDGIFRVLVGPLKDAASQAQTRTALEAAGFKNPILRKY